MPYVRRFRRTTLTAALAGALLVPSLLAGCGLTSGSPMVDDVEPGIVGKGKPLEGAKLTVTSKEFTEQLILGAIMGIAFEAAGADVLDRTGIQGSIGAREAVKGGDADGMYEYTGTAWITYQGNSKPVPDPQEQWKVVRDADRKNGLDWLPPSELNNTYALAMNPANVKKLKTKNLSDVAALLKRDPGAVTLCVESEFNNRADGLAGMKKTYGMNIPAGNITQMDAGIIYTQAAKGSCAYGEVYTTDGRIQAMDLTVMEDDKKAFPNYNAAPSINSKALKKYPAIAEILAPITAKLDNTIAQQLNAKVDVDGEDPHKVALDWMLDEGFVTE
ncbi:glycine/betaine ABC transporter substrate-binding protein [Streptomyces triticagri]|uniref:Glycine/betaine ABC transporter substrate-binding protein n=2 Tax=Streptomyces triticagri TaxID=2293568 RepID=A0A372LUR7_9ACTN|nr:glycine betaine ABC transporter substrate-binding protein [Streptomyces triticagri]RFU82406.1 glycine/betaine ABC transporter substrate-binding protein [Streptomyces triticagri]